MVYKIEIRFCVFIGKDYVYCKQLCNSISAVRGGDHLLGYPTNEAFIQSQHQL